MATLNYFTSPVANGATTLQSTVFNTLLTDYARADANTVATFKANRVGIRGLPDMKGGAIPMNWTFMLRKDMVGAQAAFRNLIGIKTVKLAASVSGYSIAIGRAISVPIEIVRVEVYNWYPQKVTLTDGTALVVWTVANVGFDAVIDPENGDVMLLSGSHEHVYEALGLLFNQVAATVPTFVPFYTAMSGLSPV